MHDPQLDLVALAAETAARFPLPLSSAADVAAATALIVGPAVAQAAAAATSHREDSKLLAA